MGAGQVKPRHVADVYKAVAGEVRDRPDYDPYDMMRIGVERAYVEGMLAASHDIAKMLDTGGSRGAVERYVMAVRRHAAGDRRRSRSRGRREV